ncbi:hypothetical protein IAU60_001451 [Kwoniella sp. DSM 27419]
MPARRSAPLSLSTGHVYSLERDPNASPPTRPSHLPVSSQATVLSSPCRPSEASHHRHLRVAASPDAEEDPEFAGMEMIGATQWEREVPTFQSRNSCTTPRDEVDDMALWFGDEAEDQAVQEQERLAIRSPIAGPSSPLQTPAFSLNHTSSDLPSGAYPQTPGTPLVHRDRSSTPMSWSASPVLQRQRRRKSAERQVDQVMLLSDDSDKENDAMRAMDPDLDPGLGTPILRGSKKRKVILSSSSEDEEGAGFRVRSPRDEAKERQVVVPDNGRSRETSRDIDLDLDVEMLDLPEDAAAMQAQEADEEMNDDAEYDLEPFPFDEVDLDVGKIKQAAQADKRVKIVRTEPQRRVTRQSQAIPGPIYQIDDDENEEENIPLRLLHNSGAVGRAGASSILDGLMPGGQGSEWFVPLIPDLPEDVQEFYLNHWRRGADKSKEKDEQRRRMNELVSEDDDDDEGPRRVPVRAKAVSVSARGRGMATKRGRYPTRGGYRGRARGRGRKR